jgi:hypothetical protein
MFWPRIPAVWHKTRPSYRRLRLVKTGGEGWVRFLDAALGSGVA